MAATKAACCFVHGGDDPSPYYCTATPTWGFHDGGNDPYIMNYACADHLGHVLDASPKEATVWPLIEGYDPQFYSAGDIEAAAKKEG